MASPMPTAQAGSGPSPAQVNAAARSLILAQALDMCIPIYSNTITTGIGSVINIPLRNVGLIKRLWVEFSAPITPSAQNQALGPLGVPTFFSNITFTDLSNQTRINTTGWHLNMISSMKRRRVFGAAYTTDTPNGFGDNFITVMAASTTLTGGAGASTIYGMLEVPLSYTDMDLRGAIYGNVVNATMNLQLTINPNLLVISTANGNQSLYKSAGAGAATLGNVTITVYQNFLDQLPVGQNGVVLPLVDLSTAYLLNNTAVSGLVQNQDNPFPYANFRDFMSTTAIYDNNGTLNVGSDINYWSLQAANYTNIFRLDPNIETLYSRMILGDDPPKGTYYFDHRHKPVSTIQYGNMQLIMNPSNVGGSAATVYLGYESMALINMITQAGSLYGT